MSDDFELLEAWRDGDRVAGDQLIRRHFDSVFRFFRTKIERGVEDMVQRTFLGCVEARDRFRAETSFRAFVLAIARNQLLLLFRERRRGGKVFDWREHSVDELQASPSQLFSAQQEVGILLRALRRLPLELQVVLELHYWEHLHVREVAHVVDIPEGTVKTRLARARRQLRTEIERAAASAKLAQSTLGRVDSWAEALHNALAPNVAADPPGQDSTS